VLAVNLTAGMISILLAGPLLMVVVSVVTCGLLFLTTSVIWRMIRGAFGKKGVNKKHSTTCWEHKQIKE